MKKKLIKRRSASAFFNSHNLMVLGLALSIGLFLLVMAGVLGARQGYKDRQRARATEVAVHYRRGEEYMAQGNRDMARAEFTLVLQLDPNNRAALAYLNRLDAATPAPTPTRSPKATATVSTRTEAAAQTFQDAMASFEKGDWEKAASGFETVRSLDPTYRPRDVEEKLFQSYANLGEALIQGGRIEEGLRALKAAQKMHPGDAKLQKDIQMASTYLDGITYWWADWDKAIAILTKLYQEDPNYLDVRAKLAEAYAERGKFRAKKGNPCEGVKDLKKALEINKTAEWQKAYYRTREACTHPTPTVAVTPSPQITGTVTVSNSIAGPAIAFSVWDGEKMVYHLMLLPPKGGKPVEVAENLHQPAFSRDGTRIAARSLRSDAVGLMTVERDGSNPVRVTTFAEDSYPSWSPDGKKLVFASNREGDRKWRVYVTWADGRSPATEIGFGNAPAWSPTGDVIAYQGCDKSGNNCGIYIRDLNTGQSYRLTKDPTDTMPAWSPDGKRLAFMTLRNGQWDIDLVSPKDGKIEPLLTSPANEGLPAWSPNGKSLAYVSDAGESWGIYVLEIKGGKSRKVYAIPKPYPDWMEERISWGR